MNPKAYYESLSDKDKVEFAERAGSSEQYFRMKLFPKSIKPKRIPRPKFIARLVVASCGNVSAEEAIKHFFESAVVDEIQSFQNNKKAA